MREESGTRQREPFFRNDFVRTVFKLDLEQFLTFQAPGLTKFCMKPYGKPENRSFKKASYPLRLQASVMAEARRVAKSEGVSLNHFINVAVAEKVSAVRAEAILRVAPVGILQILEQARKLKSSAGGG
jgi:predicted HicB family RNase H-like nuclease